MTIQTKRHANIIRGGPEGRFGLLPYQSGPTGALAQGVAAIFFWGFAMIVNQYLGVPGLISLAAIFLLAPLALFGPPRMRAAANMRMAAELAARMKAAGPEA